MKPKILALLFLLALSAAPASAAPKWLRTVRHGLSDWKFWTVAAVQISAAAWDVHSTNRCIQTFKICRETNIFLGRRPSRARLWAWGTVWTVGLLTAEAWMDGSGRDDGTWPLFMVPAAAQTTTSILAARNNQTIYRRARNICSSNPELCQ